MRAITFDPLKYANRLKAAGMEPHLAEDQAEALADALTEQTPLAAKTDLVELRMATKADLADAKTDLIQWVAGMLVCCAGRRRGDAGQVALSAAKGNSPRPSLLAPLPSRA